jgi:hypothetical protein
MPSHVRFVKLQEAVFATADFGELASKEFFHARIRLKSDSLQLADSDVNDLIHSGSQLRPEALFLPAWFDYKLRRKNMCRFKG